MKIIYPLATEKASRAMEEQNALVFIVEKNASKTEIREEAEKANINVVVAGHISSDSIGVNLFLDELEKQGIKIIPCSGLIRVSRVK